MEPFGPSKAPPSPEPDQAKAFVIMLKAGLPSEQAILYFTDSDDPKFIADLHAKWLRSRAVAKAQRELLGKDWTEMTLDEQIETALNQNYASLAYLLFSVNYITADQMQKAKLDSARTALEAKKAGTAGRTDALSMFFDDVKAGRVKLLPKPIPVN